MPKIRLFHPLPRSEEVSYNAFVGTGLVWLLWGKRVGLSFIDLRTAV